MKTTAKIIFCLLIGIFFLSFNSILFAEELKDSKKDQLSGGTVIPAKAIEAKSDQVISEKKDDFNYISANLGLARTQSTDIGNAAMHGDMETALGFALGAAAGFGFDYGRCEAEISYQKNDLSKVRIGVIDPGASGEISTLALLFNGYLDMKNKTAVTPYLSAGVGAARYSISAMPVLSGGVFTTESNDVVVFAYQFGAGVGYAVTPRFTIDLKYRYFATSNPRLGDTILHYGSHNIYLGARFSF